jgi:hypothetical protein
MDTENKEPNLTEDINPVIQEDGVIKVNLGEYNKKNKKVEVEQVAEEVPATVTPVLEEAISETLDKEPALPVLEEQQPVVFESSLEEITDEEVQERVETVTEELEEALVAQTKGIDLPENVQKLVDFMNETGGSLEDYVKLNTDYASLNEDQLLKEYYQSTRPDLDADEIDFLLEDKYQFDEEYDDEKEIKRKKLARKEQLLKAKKHLDGLKTRYYDEIKSGSKLNPEQQKAIEFFNRYQKENEVEVQLGERQKSIFEKRTQEVFANDFKGFEYSVGEKKYRFNVKNADEIKTTQSDITNFVKKFLNDKNEMADARGYHKSLFTAMNPDAVANHFYEQGKADALRESIAKAKNVDMDPRGVHEKVSDPNGWTVRSVNGVNASEFKIKIKNNKN